MSGTIHEVDPSTLTIALNVRTDAKLDKSFVASIKELGILQPPMVTANADGGYDVVLGQRRTLAAVQAGLTTIPVYVVDQSEADAARVVDQLTENDQRQALSEAERVAGYKQLSLFGISPAQIAKRTAVDRKRIDTALAVADSETATAALVEHQLTLDEAAYLVEFADNAAAVRELTKAAGEGKLAHVVAELRKKRDLFALEAKLQAELDAEKVIAMKPSNSAYGGRQEDDPEGVERIDRFGSPKDPFTELTIEEVPKKLRAGRVVVDYQRTADSYERTAFKQYFILKPEENGFSKLEYEHRVRELTPDELAERAAREAAEQERARVRDARDLAASVRREWLSQFLGSKARPDVLQFVSRMSLLNDLQHDEFACSLLGVAAEPLALAEFIERSERHAVDVLLAATFAAAEAAIHPTVSWKGPDWSVVEVYLPQLDVWGYGMSEAEHGLIAIAAEQAEGEADDDEDESGYAYNDDEDPE